MENYIVSARKYRPSTFESVVGQKSLTTTLKNAILTHKLAHAYLFCGPRGVGKTTCARIFAKTINCQHLTADGEACNECESCRAFNEQRSYNIHELDAASNNSVEDIRSLIEQVRIPPQIGQYKVYIIDEVHMLSQAAFNAFLKTLEEPPHHAIFILATTEKHKILPTILSRCQIYDFNRISVNDIAEHLQYVADKEHIHVEPEALHVIAQKADGGMRDALSIFDQVVSFTQGNVTYKSVIENLNVLDYEYYFKMTDLLRANKVSEAMLLLNSVLNKGFDGNLFINGLGAHFRNLLVSRDPSTLPLLETSESVRQRYCDQAKQCPPKFLYRAMKICNDCDLNYRISKNKRLLVEISLIQIAQIGDGEDSPGCGQSPTKKLKPLFVKQVMAATATASAEQPKTAQPVVYTQPTTEAPGKVASSNPILSTEPEKKRMPTLKVSSLGMSIRNPQQAGNAGDTPNSILHPTAEAAKQEDKPFNEEELRYHWFEFINMLPVEEAANAGRMKTMRPQLVSDTTFEVLVENEIVQKYMESIRPRIEQHLRTSMHNSKVSMAVRISESTESAPKAYSRVEQFKMMSQKNPILQKFTEAFDLSFS